MKSGLNPLTQSEIKAIAKKLNVKPEDVSEMEMRIAGQDLALEPDQDEDRFRS